PASWKEIPTSAPGNETNFIKVERAIPAAKAGEQDQTLENFGVGTFGFTGPPPSDEQFAELCEDFSKQFARGFPNYRKTSQGQTSVGRYRGYEFRFTARVDDPKGPVTLWGRCVFVIAADDRGPGATLVMLATNLAAEYRSENDLGEKGEMPVI